MKILLVAATSMEVKLLTDELKFVRKISSTLTSYQFDTKTIDVLVTGIGTTFTTFHLTQTLMKNFYNLVLSAGIAGSLSADLKIGEVVNVVSDEFADLGIEYPDGFLTLFESGFIKEDEFPFKSGRLNATQSDGLMDFKKVKGITTNKSHGNVKSIAELHEKFSAQVESMEGAAVFYVCSQFGVPCFQLRSISNFVEPRDPLQWNIPLALENLKNSVLRTLSNLTVNVG